MLIPTIFQDYPKCVPKKGILHIGAHMCEEASLYHSIGIDDKDILWIEGNPDIIDKNQKNIINAVINDIDNQSVTFIITNNIESSSILELYTHKQEHPHIHEIQRRMVNTITLNSLYEQKQIPYDRYDFINIDIQGAELKALKGATKILPHVNAIYAEVNVKELYKGCGLMHEIDNYLEGYGFKRIATKILEYGWGDALYLRV